MGAVESAVAVNFDLLVSMLQFDFLSALCACARAPPLATSAVMGELMSTSQGCV